MYGLPDNALVGAGKRIKGAVKVDTKKPARNLEGNLVAFVIWSFFQICIAVAPRLAKYRFFWTKEKKEREKSL